MTQKSTVFTWFIGGAAAGGRRGGPRWRGDQPITRDGFTPTDRDYLFKYSEGGRRLRS